MANSRTETVCPAVFDRAGVLLLDRSRFRDGVARLGRANPGKQVEVVVRVRPELRSDEQHRRYWALLEEWVELAGYESKEDLHEDLKRQFLGLELVDDVQEGRRMRVRSTTTLSRAQFADYVSRCERLMARMHG